MIKNIFKNVRLTTLFITFVIMICLLEGCGIDKTVKIGVDETVTASEYVKSYLDMRTLKEVSDEMVRNLDCPKEILEVREDYAIDYCADTFIMPFEDEQADTAPYAHLREGGKSRESLEAFAKAFLKSCKYEIADDVVKNDDDSYTVRVTLYPRGFIDLIEYLPLEYLTEWADKANNVDDVTTLFSKMTEILEEVPYGDAVEMEVKVEKSDDGTYSADEDMAKVLAVMLMGDYD